jgi:uncharacterized membrane protein YphA (DoxX/SURF4 family)
MTAMASTTRTAKNAPAEQPGGLRGFIAAYGEWISLVARLLLATMWFFYSLPKLSQPAQNVQSVRNFRILPDSLAHTWGYAQPWLEMCFGILILLGLGTRLVALFSTLLLLTYIGGIMSLGARGIHITCGCGGAGSPLEPGKRTTYIRDVFRDILFMLPALWLLWKPLSKFSLERALLGDPIE